jgi:hypothetical protein
MRFSLRHDIAFPGQGVFIHMKIAVSVFKECVSPRADIADSLWIYHIDKIKGIISSKETCNTSYKQPSQLIGFLKEKDVDTIVCGGCPKFLMRMLLFSGVDVVPGIFGNPDHVACQLARGEFVSIPPALSNGMQDIFCCHRKPDGIGPCSRKKKIDKKIDKRN